MDKNSLEVTLGAFSLKAVGRTALVILAMMTISAIGILMGDTEQVAALIHVFASLLTNRAAS